MKVVLDLSGVRNFDDFYKRISDLFGFPDFFGKNVHALIDCLFNLRYPDSRMTGFNISDSEYLIVEVFGFSGLPQEIMETLAYAIEFANFKLICKNQLPAMALLLNRRA